jgi:ABC-type sugar transport system substrate-binding protein
MKKLFLLVLGSVFVIFGLNSCQKKDEKGSQAGLARSNTIKLAYIVRDTGSIYSQYIIDFEEGCKRLGVESMILSYEGDSTKFPAACENAVTRGASAVYTWPDDQSMADYGAEYFSNLGIPNVVMGLESEKADACMVADQFAMGQQLAEMAAAWVDEHWGNKKFEWAILEYTKSPHVAQRTKGMREMLTDLCKNGTMAAALEAENLEKGMNQTENLLQLHPNVQLLICCEDTAAMGAVEVFRAAGKTGDNYAIFGAVFGDQVGNAILRGDVYRASIRFQSYRENAAKGSDSVSVLYKLLMGEKVAHLQSSGFSPVTPENVRESMAEFGYEIKE